MKTKLLTLLFLLPFAAKAQGDIFFSWASRDVHYAPSGRPACSLTTDTAVCAWRGERVGAQAVIYAPKSTGALQLRVSDFKGKKRIAADRATVRFVSYVTTNCYQTCGYPNLKKLTPYPVPDIIEQDGAQKFATNETRPVWLTIEVPSDAEAGAYRAQVELIDSLSRRVVKKLQLTLRVNERTLPTPREQRFHTDFWQQPYSVARYYDVPRWSDEHLSLLKPYLTLLARSGQKVVSAILFYEPWGEQSEDKFDAMVQTTRRADGSWTYDYTTFDRWVELCEECGISGGINCFSMVPWDMTFTYFDEATRREVQLKAKTDSKEYEELWTAFLKNFATHLREKGWFEKTCIAMDERGLPNMLDAYRIAKNAVPDMRMALAGTYHEELADKLADYCIGWGEQFSDDERQMRRERGYVSTTYTCCSTAAPNLFSNSLPAEAVYLPLYCVANGFDGYLHWSWMNWTQDPLHDSRFRMFAPGDTYIIYPGPRSSVRYERYIEGVAQAEKVNILRASYAERGDTARLNRLTALLEKFKTPTVNDPTTIADEVREMETFLNE